ncbi:MAG: signal peptidase II [Candidatus Uhrbacteria bacterium]
MKKLTLVLIPTALVLVLADEVVKNIALQKLPNEGSFDLSGFIDLAIHKNFGIAFNLPLAQNLTITITVILISVFCWLAWKSIQNKPHLTNASILIIAGALGNLFDRIAYGFTVDYIILLGRSAINLSDVLILTGVVWLLLASRKTHNSPGGAGPGYAG